ncbi:hypothetical protein B0H11DRAFT_1931005 [Mycena galericulata]|nr:hypothetical protein B0H11DRAFT_1931005 [Mycena galericulata]
MLVGSFPFREGYCNVIIICTGPPETHLHYYPSGQTGNTGLIHEGGKSPSAVTVPSDTFRVVRCIGSGRSKQFLRSEEDQLLEREDVRRKGMEGGDRAWGSTAASSGCISETWEAWSASTHN